nr:ribonuclease H-like domain-containing protein [Tanacetum cinerariifolium]
MTGTNNRGNNVSGGASNGYDNTTNDLLVKLLSHLGNMGLNFLPNVVSNTFRDTNTLAGSQTSPFAYQTGPPPYSGLTYAPPGSSRSLELGFSALHLILLVLGFITVVVTSLFIYKHGTNIAYLLLYVDDIVLIASPKTLLQQIISSLHQEFFMTDLGSLNYFLGISVTRDSSEMFLSQHKYATEILERAGMVSCNSSRTPANIESKLVQRVCLYMHDPREPHFSDVKRGLRYVRGTLDYGLQLFSSSTTDLVAYSDANWVCYSKTDFGILCIS